MKALICVVIAFALGWLVAYLIFGMKNKTHGFLFVEDGMDHPDIYMQLSIDIPELHKLSTVKLSVKRLKRGNENSQ